MTGKNFDPTTAPNMIRRGLIDGELFYDGGMLKQFHESSRISLTFIRGEYDGPIASTELTLLKNPAIGDQQWAYDGRIQLQDADAFTKDALFDLLGERCQETDDVELNEFYFNNSRLLTAKKSGALASVSMYQADGLITFSNNRRFVGATQKEIAMSLTAPMIHEDLNGKVHPHFLSHVANFIMVTNVVSQLVDGRPKFERVAITSKRTYYATRDGEFMDTPPKWDASLSQKSAGGHPELVASESTLLLEDIAGNDDLRSELMQLATAFKNPEAMKQWGVEIPKGVYLYGPPGTGKTMYAQALANQIGGELWEIHSSDIYDKWLGNSEKNLKEIFRKAQAIKKPTVMLWDEFDGLIASGRDDGESHSVERVAAAFKKGIIALRENPDVITVAITNNPDNVNEALVREGRFDIKHSVSLPSQDTRTKIFANHIAAKATELNSETFTAFGDDLDLPALSKISEGMSGAAIATAVQRAAFNKAMEQAAGQTPGPISQQDLVKVINDMRRS